MTQARATDSSEPVRSSEGEDDDFYLRLPTRFTLSEATDPAVGRRLPGSWLVCVADVAGSTRAIQDGKYKQVNVAGAAVIGALLNAVRPLDVPYAFGGDGAAVAVPGSYRDRAGQALRGVSASVERAFGLSLRVGAIRAGELAQRNRPVHLARRSLSPYYAQAVFTGGGLELAESLLKSGESAVDRFEDLPADPTAANLAGLECRWQDVPSPRGQTIALLVLGRSEDPSKLAGVYRRTLDQVERIFGQEDRSRPITVRGLRLTLQPRRLQAEVALRSAAGGSLARWLYQQKALVETAIGSVLMNWGVRLGGVDWSRYKPDVVANSDARKLDDTLRLILAGGPEQAAELEGWLKAEQAAGRLWYGLHRAESAHVTCLIEDRKGRHLHFIDATGGGYALAAAQLKRLLKGQAADEPSQAADPAP